MCNVNFPILAYIAYLTVGVLFLVQDHGEAARCQPSLLWLYVLLSLVVSLFRFNSVMGLVKSCVAVGYSGHTVVDFGMAAWGARELFLTACESLAHSSLWLYGLVTASLYLLCGVVILSGLFGLCVQRRRAAAVGSTSTPAVTALDPVRLLDAGVGGDTEI